MKNPDEIKRKIRDLKKRQLFLSTRLPDKTYAKRLKALENAWVESFNALAARCINGVHEI
jgi:hypothetical protein